jgi:hypothetical protein
VVAVAKMAPVFGSRATTAPRALPGSAFNPAYAARWAAGLRVRSTLPPCGWLSPSRPTIRLTNRLESLPERMEFSEFSTAVVP